MSINYVDYLHKLWCRTIKSNTNKKLRSILLFAFTATITVAIAIAIKGFIIACCNLSNLGFANALIIASTFIPALSRAILVDKYPSVFSNVFFVHGMKKFDPKLTNHLLNVNWQTLARMSFKISSDFLP